MFNDYVNVIILFLMIILGYILTKIAIFDKAMERSLSQFIMKVALPTEIFLRITRDFSENELLNLLKEAILPLFSVSLLFLLSFLLVKVLHIPVGHSGIFSLNFSTSSTAFLGIPIALTLFGDKGVPYALIYYISNSLLFWTLGVFLVNKDAASITGTQEKLSFGKIIKSVVNPVIIGFLLGLLLVLLSLKLPPLAQTFFGYIGGTTTPLAMLYVGISIYTTGIKNIKISKGTYGVLMGRYFFAPLIILLLAHVLPVSQLMVKVSFVLAVLPAANGSIILAGEKNVDVDFATSSVLLTTLIYLIYLPIVLSVVHFI